jgi:hypothetical protein
MARKQIHVVPNSKEGWDVKQSGNPKPLKHFETKAPAVDYGKKVAKKEEAEFIPHKKDMTIQNPNSYGTDPNPPKDKRH